MVDLKHHSSFWINVDLTENKQLCDYGLKKKGWSEIRMDNRVYAVPRVEASVIRSIIERSGVDYSHIIVEASNSLAQIMKEARERANGYPIEKKQTLIEGYVTE